MIPVSLVTGFLGSGKTTFLKKISSSHFGETIVFLVNEFSPVNIDGQLIESGKGRVVAVPGGSIFCNCLVTDFVAHLKNLKESVGINASEDISGLVIEASGIASPRVIHRLFEETGMDAIYEIKSVISIVAPGTFTKLLATLPNIREQVAASDVVIINKIDMFEEELICDTEKLVQDIAPRASIHRSSFCDVDIDLFEHRTKGDAEGEYAKCSDPNYCSFTVTADQIVEKETFEKIISKNAAGIYRIKGFINTGDASCYVDYSDDELSFSPAGKTNEHPPQLVFIVRGDMHNFQDYVTDLLRTP